MLSTKRLLLAFIPAFLLLALTIFIRIVQYQPLNPKPEQAGNPEEFVIPISPNDPILGNKKAPKTLIAFEDFGCEHCKVQSELLDQVLQEHPNAFKLIWKGLPVSKFPVDTRASHRYAFCFHEQQKFEEFESYAFANYQNLSQAVLDAIVSQVDINKKVLDECLSSTRPDAHIAQVEQIARALNIQAVPAIFIDNKQITTPQTKEEWVALLGL